MNTRSAISLLLSIGVCIAGTRARADDARTHFLRGQAAYQAGDNETAIREWSAAYQKDPRPLLQYNLSQAYERLGKLNEAATALDHYLSTADPKDGHLPDARARRAAIKERLAHTGIRVTGGPEGARIVVDDREWGRTPRPDAIEVAPGSHRVVLKLDGYREFNSVVVVPAGQTVDVSVEMEPSPVAGTAFTGGPAAAGSESQAPAVLGTSAQPAKEPEPARSPLPLVLMGVGAGGVITGAILGGLALRKAGNAPSKDSSEADSARGLALGADIAIGVGIAALGAGALWWLLSSPSKETPPSSKNAGSVSRLRWNATVGRSGASANATFEF